MNQTCKKFFSLALLGAAFTARGADSDDSTPIGKSFFTQRSQGSNVARWMAGEAHLRHFPDTDCINGTLAIAAEYGQTFRNKDLAKYFSFNGTQSMIFGPARTTSTGGSVNNTTDVFARNFLLNDDFNGTLTFKPNVRNFVLDINFYLGLDEWLCGLWAQVDVPVNWTSWKLGICQEITSQGTTVAANRLGNSNPAPSNLTSLIQAVDGQTPNPNFPAVKQTLQYARMSDKNHTKSGVADVTFILGYDFIQNECAYLGIQAAVIAPTGNRPDGVYVFEPIVGNGKHVEFGGGINAAYELWNNGCDQSFGVYLEGYVYHVFRAKQRRTFDLKANGIGSRYLLFKKFTGATPLAYASEVVFGPNITTLDCKVQNDVHGDAALMFDYKNGGFTFDIGYNVWGRTKDKVHITGTIEPNTYGVQGDTVTANTIDNTTVNNTQSLSTINGTFLPVLTSIEGVISGGDAVTITAADLDPDSAAAPSAVSHKVFTNFGYTWEHCEYMPFLGIGGEVEFSGKKRSAFNQWGVWVKGGFAFA